MLDIISLIIGNSLMFATPLMFAALGGVISEKSGVVNIGLEGMMIIGAFAAAGVTAVTNQPWLGFLMAGLAGAALALLHAIACVSFKADQTISGVALNFIGPGVALFLCRKFFAGATTTTSLVNKIPKILSNEQVNGRQFLQNINVDVTVIIALIITFFIWFIFYKTKLGLRIIAVGEHPAAADTLGVNVYGIRYLTVILSGVLAGFGGAAKSIAISNGFSPVVISGLGFMALAAVIFGKWTPQGAVGACLLFGFAQSLTIIVNSQKVKIPTQIIAMFPYLITILVLVFFVGRSVAPRANGQPYEKGFR